MENMVSVRATINGVLHRNNMTFETVQIAKKEIALDRRFLVNLENAVTALKDDSTVTIYFMNNNIAVLMKDSYQVSGKDAVTFQRFGGKIAKDFFTAIDEEIERLENEEQ